MCNQQPENANNSLKLCLHTLFIIEYLIMISFIILDYMTINLRNEFDNLHFINGYSTYIYYIFI